MRSYVTLRHAPLLLFALLLALGACQRRESVDTLRSAYYWSTTWKMDSAKVRFIRQHHIRRLYVRYFDVVRDADGQARPNATLRFPDEMGWGGEHAAPTSPVPRGVEVVPVVYLVNDCLRPAPHATSPDTLATMVLRRILAMSQAHGLQDIREVQVDCDWTATTAHAYFRFLTALRQQAHGRHLRLSATIRLHQLALEAPPVDRGVLMMYNTGDARRLACHKPILDMAAAAPYLGHLAAYPLPLAAAYPLFTWRILFREGRFVGFLHADDDLPVLPGDSIVVRRPELTDILQAVRAIRLRRPDACDEVILFDLSTPNILRFNPLDYDKIYRHP